MHIILHSLATHLVRQAVRAAGVILGLIFIWQTLVQVCYAILGMGAYCIQGARSPCLRLQAAGSAPNKRVMRHDNVRIELKIQHQGAWLHLLHAKIKPGDEAHVRQAWNVAWVVWKVPLYWAQQFYGPSLTPHVTMQKGLPHTLTAPLAVALAQWPRALMQRAGQALRTSISRTWILRPLQSCRPSAPRQPSSRHAPRAGARIRFSPGPPRSEHRRVAQLPVAP